VVRNEENRGFAAAMNQALADARTPTLVSLNDDVIVAPGWLARLEHHLEDDQVGLVSAVTNRSGDEAEVTASYSTYGEFRAFALARAHARAGVARKTEGVAMFCTAFRRDLFRRVGPFDERFGAGMFEDDDYVRRVHLDGRIVVCAEDVVVHHFGGATLGRLVEYGAYGPLFHENRRRFEEKWGVVWQPRRRLPDDLYEGLRESVRAAVRNALPPGRTVLVTSRGDDELLRLDGLRARHFPATSEGVYAGHHPADSAAAVATLEEERARGADYLVLPRTAYWWLEHYDAFRRHVEARYVPIDVAGDICRIFDLSEPEDIV
jgi:glycosyltransferase involved in cell wall biosynthesis